MHEFGTVPKQAWEKINNFGVNITVSTGLLLSNLYGREDLVVHASDSLARKAEYAGLSALPAPLTLSNEPLDVGIEIATTAIGLEIGRRTSTGSEMVYTAVGAQALSCAMDAAVDNSGWLSKAEQAQEDVGFSAITTAWVTKFLLDKSFSSTSKEERLRWRVGTAAFIGAMTVGTYWLEGKHGGKLDMTSHAGGSIAGALSHRSGKWRKQQTLVNDKSYQITR